MQTTALFDMNALITAPPKTPTEKKKVRKERHSIAETLATIRQLHDELNEKLYAAKSQDRPGVSSPQEAADILMGFLEPLEHEELWVLVLDVRNKVKKIVKLYQGSVNSSQVRIGELFREAIVENAPAIILAHNHPSGDPSPSPDDITVTRSAVTAGKLLDIQVLDHIVVGAGRFISLKERGVGFS